MENEIEYSDDMREFDKDMDELRQKTQEFWDNVEARSVSEFSRKDRLRYLTMQFEIMNRIAIRKHIAEMKEEK